MSGVKRSWKMLAMSAIVCSWLADGSRASDAFQEPSPSPLPTGPSTYSLFAGEQLSYDDNLYRLPASANLAALVGAAASRQEVIDTVSLGTDLHWYDGLQAVDLHARAEDNRFLDNRSLSNLSGQGDVTWDWQFGERLSGQAGAQYFRALTNFGSTDYYALDLVDRVDYFAGARYRVGPQVTLFGGIDGADTSLSALPEKIYDFRSKAGNGGVEFSSASGNTVSVEYRYTDARFPTVFVLNGAPFNSDYDEDTALVTVKYVLSAATKLEASAGYLRRGYPYSEFAAFSGSIGRASLEWQPTDALDVVLTGRHELRAYVDSESDYFVSNGGSIEPEWKATAALTLALAFSHENHDYIGSSPSALTFASRHDTVTTEKARLTYNPAPCLTATLTYQFARRDSNRAILEFDDNIATANVIFKFQL
ncbi:MAG: outer membrane beta-barrel protein [Steroidobacteraceae bacterium]